MEKSEKMKEAFASAKIPEEIVPFISVENEEQLGQFVTAAKNSGIDFAAMAKRSEEESAAALVRRSMGLE